MKRLVCLLMIVLSTPAMSATRYLAPDGTDSGNATTEATAWATLAYALGGSSAMAAGDTLIVCAGVDGNPGTGTWSGGTEPYQLQPAVALSGTASDLTTIIADTLCTIVFDGSARTGTSQYALYFRSISGNHRGGYSISGITFSGYEDESTYDPTNGIIFINNAGYGSTAGPYEITDCKFIAGSTDSTNTALYVNVNTPATDLVGPITFIRNTVTGAGGANGVVLKSTVNSTISNNQFIRDTARLDDRSDDTPQAVWLGNTYCYNNTIAENRIVGYDHGIIIYGTWNTVTRNVIHDLSDDFIFGQASASILNRYNTVSDNLCYNGGDDGIEVRGAYNAVTGNTVFNVNDSGNAWLMAATPCTSCVITDNIFADSYTDDALLLQAGSTGMTIDGNTWYDADGLTWNDAAGGNGSTTTFSTYQGWGFDTNGVNSDPGFVSSDTSAVNLHPTAVGYRRGIRGRTVGALPCRPCWWWQISPSSDTGDSIHVIVTDPSGDETWYDNRAIWDFDGRRVLDLDVSGETGQWVAAWQVFSSGDSSGYADDHEVYASAASLASLVEDTLIADINNAPLTTSETASAVWDALTANHSDNNTTGEVIGNMNTVYTNTSQIGVDLEADLGVDLSAMSAAISALPSAAATASAVDDTLSATHGSAAWTDAGVTLGNGSNDVAIFVKASADSSAISGARISVWSTDYATRHFKTTTGSDGAIDAALDAGTYAWTASDPGVYAPGSGTFTVSTDPDTATVYLAGIALSAAADPDYCTMYVDVADWFGTEVDNIEVKVRFDGQLGYGGGLLMAGAIMDTTGTPTTGRATLTIPRSSAMTSPDGVSTFTFTFTDLLRTTTRRANPYPSFTISGVSVPDSTSANLRYNTPGVD